MNTEPKFKIGDTVYYAQMNCVEKSVKCPECFGLKYLVVILGNQSEVTIDCVSCASGYELPKGYVSYNSWEPTTTLVTIKGMDIRENEITYWFQEGYGTSKESVFSTQELAEIRALELAEEHNKQELERIYRKEKNNRSWAWNVHYHRDCIKRAEKEMAYHTAKLNVAKAHKKEEKTNPIQNQA